MAKECIYFSDRFNEAFDKMLSEFRKSSEKSRQNYRNLAASLCSYSKKDFLCLTRSDVCAYFGELGKLSESTRHQRLSVFRGIAKYMDNKACVSQNLSDVFTGVSTDQRKIYTELEDLPEFSDIDKVLGILKKNNSLDLFVICTLALETGLSLADILSMNYANFMTDKEGRSHIRIEPATEKGETRLIPLRKETALLVDRLGRQNAVNRNGMLTFTGRDPIFQNEHGKRLSERMVQYGINSACREASVKSFGISRLRTIAMASMLKNGAPVELLAKSVDETGTWFFHLNYVIKDLDTAPATYCHIKIDW